MFRRYIELQLFCGHNLSIYDAYNVISHDKRFALLNR